jgi:nucleotide-binding universal stress UspA family protein
MYGGMNTVYPESFDFTESSKALLRNLDEFGAAEFPGVDVSSIVDVGEPASLIVEYAQGNGVGLIAMPTHGYGAFRRTLLGSVTAKVLHDTSIPVWTSAHAPEPSHRAHPQARHIIVAIDPTKDEQPTLDTALALSGQTGATLDIVTAVAEGVIAPGMADAKLEELLIEGTREQLAKLRFDRNAVGVIVEIGSPAKIVRDAALAKRADLIVAGRGSIHGILRSLFANSYAIIREAPCPVLSL